MLAVHLDHRALGRAKPGVKSEAEMGERPRGNQIRARNQPGLQVPKEKQEPLTLWNKGRWFSSCLSL